MIKNEYNKELTTKSNNNSISSFKNKVRKDGKGNLIIKKKLPVKKTKHHAYLIDSLVPGKDIANVVEIESYKKYNLDEEEEIEEEPEQQPQGEKLEDKNVVTTHGCCNIF